MYYIQNLKWRHIQNYGVNPLSRQYDLNYEYETLSDVSSWNFVKKCQEAYASNGNEIKNVTSQEFKITLATNHGTGNMPELSTCSLAHLSSWSFVNVHHACSIKLCRADNASRTKRACCIPYVDIELVVSIKYDDSCDGCDSWANQRKFIWFAVSIIYLPLMRWLLAVSIL